MNYQFWTRKSEMSEIVEHHASGACVDDVTQTQVGHPVQKGENVRSWLFSAHDDDSIVLLGVIRQDGDHHVSV